MSWAVLESILGPLTPLDLWVMLLKEEKCAAVAARACFQAQALECMTHLTVSHPHVSLYFFLQHPNLEKVW